MDVIMGFLSQGLSAFVPFVILLGVLIFVHELGHFLVAKYFGVRVETFSLGFGKKIFQYKKGDTTYALSLIPLGGYVKMFGDDASAEIDSGEKKYSFLHKPVSQRIWIVLAGPLMNLFFAILLFSVVSIMGEETRGTRVGDVALGSQAYQQGFRSGDKIVSIGEKLVQSWSDVQKELHQAMGGKVRVIVEREGSASQQTIEATPELVENPNILGVESKVGDIPGLANTSRASFIGVTSKDSLAGKAGLRTGDLVTHVNDQAISYWRQFEAALRSQTGKVTIKYKRAEGEKNAIEGSTELVLPSDRVSNLSVLGVDNSELYVAQVGSDTPAKRAGILEGDKISSINGNKIQAWPQVLEVIKSYQEGQGSLKIEVLRDGVVKEFSLVPELMESRDKHGLHEKRFMVGIGTWIGEVGPEIVKITANNPMDVIKRGVQRTYDVTVMTVMSFVKLFQGTISPRNIGGVISIGQAASETFKIGLSHFISMMAIISVNLFILNLLPVPVLDGGHLVFYTIEALKGSPLSLKKMEMAQKFGFVVLMSLMVFALFNDVTGLFTRWK